MHEIADHPRAEANRAFQRAVQLHTGGQLEAAVDAYRAILEGYPNAPGCWSNLGAALYKLERRDETIEVLRQGTRVCPDSVDLHYELGNAGARPGGILRNGGAHAGVYCLALPEADRRGRAARARCAAPGVAHRHLQRSPTVECGSGRLRADRPRWGTPPIRTAWRRSGTGSSSARRQPTCWPASWTTAGKSNRHRLQGGAGHARVSRSRPRTCRCATRHSTRPTC